MKKLLFIFLLFFSLCINAQDNTVQSTDKKDQVEMADTFRKDGKIYVVLAVVLIIFTGILAYLFILEKKISKIEKEHHL